MARPRKDATSHGERPAASITSVARRAGVSIATVSRIMNGVAKKASPETVEKVRQAVAELGYRPVSVGRALRTRESRLVALIAANVGNPAMAAIAASAETALREAGYVMVLCDNHDRADLQDEYLLEMRAQLVRGVVLLGAVPSAQLEVAIASGDPLLFVNRRSPVPGDTAFVGIDNHKAGREVAAHFLRRGVRDVAVIHGPLSSSATAERLSGFLDAMAEAGSPVSPADVLTASGLDHLAIGHAATMRLMNQRKVPRGLFCLSDLIAYGAHKALQQAAFAVPGDVDIIGFDDNPLNDWLAPWLNSVRVPYNAFGAAIVRGLEGVWSGKGPCDVTLQHALVERAGSPGASPAAMAMAKPLA